MIRASLIGPMIGIDMVWFANHLPNVASKIKPQRSIGEPDQHFKDSIGNERKQQNLVHQNGDMR